MIIFPHPLLLVEWTRLKEVHASICWMRIAIILAIAFLALDANALIINVGGDPAIARGAAGAAVGVGDPTRTNRVRSYGVEGWFGVDVGYYSSEPPRQRYVSPWRAPDHAVIIGTRSSWWDDPSLGIHTRSSAGARNNPYYTECYRGCWP